MASGNNVSHANNKTKRTIIPNVRAKSLKSEVLGKIKITVSSAGMRTIDKHGGIDRYLLGQKIHDPLLKRIKRRIQKVLALQKSSD